MHWCNNSSGAENHSPRPNCTQRLPSVEIPYFNPGPPRLKEPSIWLPSSRLFPNENILQPVAIPTPYVLPVMVAFDTSTVTERDPLPAPIPVSLYVTMQFSIFDAPIILNPRAQKPICTLPDTTLSRIVIRPPSITMP